MWRNLSTQLEHMINWPRDNDCMIGKKLVYMALVVFLTGLMVSSVAAIDIKSPDLEYSNQDNLTVKVENASDLENYTFSVEADGDTRVDGAGFSAKDDNILINSSHDLGDVSHTEEVNITVKASQIDPGDNISNSTVFTIDREGPKFDVESPVNAENTSELLQLNITDNDISDLFVEYKITSGYSEKGLDREINVSDQVSSPGDYTLDLNIADQAGNSAQKSIDFTYDDVPPSYTGREPDFINESINLDESFSDVASGLKNSSFSILSEGSVVGDLENLDLGERVGSLDDSLDHSETYTVEIKAEDFAGNNATQEFTATADFQAPTLTRNDPENISFSVSGDQTFDIGFSDTVSSISDNTYFRIPDYDFNLNDNTFISVFVDSEQFEGSQGFDEAGLQGVYDTTILDDGVYDFVLGVKDEAGNVNRTEFELSISNNPPVINSVEYDGKDLDNGSIVTDGDISVDVSSNGVELQDLTYSWGSQQSGSIEDGGFEVNVSDGNYTLEITAEDALGNAESETFQNVLVETTLPELDLSRENSEGWRSSHNISVSCSDGGSGVEETAVFAGDDRVKDWRETGETSFNISEHGQRAFEFRCKDKAGNVQSETLSLKIDSRDPEVEGFTPEEGSEDVNVSTDFEVRISEDSVLSGLDASSSDLDVSKGTVSNVTSGESVLSGDLSDMPFTSTITVNGTLADKSGNVNRFEMSFNTKQEPAEWITIAESVRVSEEMELGVMRRDIAKDVGDIDISVENSDSISEFDLRRSEEGEASVTVVEQDGIPEDFEAPNGTVYKYVGVETEGIESDEIISSSMSFEVNSSWIESNGGQESISVVRNQGDGWRGLNQSTRRVGETVVVSVEVSEFSWFAVKSDNPGSGGLLSGFSLPSFELEFGLADLMTAGLLVAIVILVLYLLELLEIIKLPYNITEKLKELI